MFSTAVPLRAGRGRPAEIVASAQSCAAAPLPAPSGVQQAQPSSASEFLGERAGRRFLAGRRAARSAAVAASVALPAVASSQQVKDASSTESQSATARTDAQFMEHAKAGYNLIPIYRRIFSDQLTPVMAYRRLNPTDDPTVPSFLLESVVNGDQQGRYSFVGSDPAMEILARGDGVEVLRHPRGGSIQMEHMKADDPIKLVKEVQQEWNPVPAQSVGLPDAFCGGWSGYVSYDTVRYTEAESLPFENAPEDDRRLPDVNLGLYRKVVVFDNVSKLAYAILWVDMREHVSAEEALGTGKLELEELVAKLTKPTAADDGLPVGEVSLDLAGRRPGVMASNMTKEEFMKGFDGAMHHIGEGNSFQIVLSQRFERKTQATPLEIYRALRVVNPSPYMIYMQCRGCVLVASSPEILTRIHKREITNRPLAGTRWRGKTPEEDAALECELLADEKDRAEHVMLVDLGRNDVGKVSKSGTVRVPKLMVVERYSHVMHISSTVTGELLDGMDAWDALQSELPAGTVSGAPKIRAIQIIDELEKHRRGPYGGGIGVVGFEGNMDMALALRTMVVPVKKGQEAAAAPGQRPEWTVHIQAGAGLVADSVKESEYQETVNKAAALARAVDLAEEAFM